MAALAEIALKLSTLPLTELTPMGSCKVSPGFKVISPGLRVQEGGGGAQLASTKQSSSLSQPSGSQVLVLCLSSAEHEPPPQAPSIQPSQLHAGAAAQHPAFEQAPQNQS